MLLGADYIVEENSTEEDFRENKFYLKDSVRLQLRSDVPLGSNLSEV